MAGDDRWCPNCARMVRPRESRPFGGVLLTATLLPIIWLAAWLAIGFWLSVVVAIFALMLLGATVAEKSRSCPICGTRQLREPPPTGA
jgi:hypothetical protein